MREKILARTIEDIKAGKVWLTRKTRQRWDLEWMNPPYKPRCPMAALNCHGGLLPGSCYRKWNECILNGKDWETIDKIFTLGEKGKTEIKS